MVLVVKLSTEEAAVVCRVKAKVIRVIVVSISVAIIVRKDLDRKPMALFPVTEDTVASKNEMDIAGDSTFENKL